MPQIQIDTALLQDGINEAVNQANIYTNQEVLEAILAANGYTDQEIQNVISGFQGTLFLSDPAPAEDGIYFFGESGTYSNFGDIVVDLTQGLVYGTKTGPVYTKTIIPIDLSTYAKQVDLLAIKDKTDSIEELAPGVATFTDEAGNVIMRITNQGMESAGVKSETFNVSDVTIKTTPDYAFAITDEKGYMCSYTDQYGNTFTLNGQGGTDSLKNKKVSILGDSISTGASGGTTTSTVYWGLMKTWHNLDVFVNAISGSQVGANNTVNRFMNPDRWGSLNSVFTPDIILVFGGTNDFGAITTATPMGTISDPDDGSSVTFYGALKYLLKSITNANRTSRVFYMTPLMRADRSFPAVNPTTLLLFTQYISAIKEVCFLYNVTVIDTFQESIFTFSNMDESGLYSTDKLHPNPAGHLKLAEYLSNKLSQYFKP